MLTIDDLPPGYSQDPPSTPTTKTYCNYKPAAPVQAQVDRDFTKGGGMSSEFLSITLRQYASPLIAKRILQQTRRVLHRCHSEDWEGSHITYALMSTPKLGDGSLGVKLTADGTALMQNYVLVGPTLISVNGGGMISTDADVLAATTTKQVRRYTAAATK